MSSAKCSRTSDIARNIKNGSYISMRKFHNYGSIVEDSILAQQAEADRRLRLIQERRAKANQIRPK
jgi:hypothetical protein